MLIDAEEGQLPPVEGQVVALLVVRPPDTASILVSSWQFDFPGAAPGGGGPYAPFTMPEGVLLWTTNSPVSTYQFGWMPEQTLRFDVGVLPGSPATISAQLFCYLSTPVPGGAVGPGPCNPQGSSYAASPALWFSY